MGKDTKFVFSSFHPHFIASAFSTVGCQELLKNEDSHQRFGRSRIISPHFTRDGQNRE
jgi:hypothetical protein